MQQQTSLKNRAPSLRVFFALGLAWSVLAGALVLAVYRFQLSARLAYLLALIPCVPACAIAMLAWRTRAQETDKYLRRYYMGVSLFAAPLLLLTVLLVLSDLWFARDFTFAALLACFPLVFGIIPAAALMMSKQMRGPDGLSLPSPLRIKLATPSARRILRMTALYFVYIAFDFVSHVLLAAPGALRGISAYVIALLPVLPLFGLIPIYNEYMKEEQDEFQRQLFHQSILWAFLGTLVIASVMGRLQDHALLGRLKDFFRPYSVFPVFWWLQLEAGLVMNAVQDLRIRAQDKREKAAR